MLLSQKTSINQTVNYQPEGFEVITLTIKREDLLHPEISGNKYRKLRYNLQEANNLKYNTLLTFGGAYSNHIAATAFAAHEFNFKSIGVIRGDELANQKQAIATNPTLNFAQQCGMQFYFVSRETYRQKDEQWFLTHLKEKFGDFYHVPQGGTNHLAVKGCEEILSESDKIFDYICCAVGSGGTVSGIIKSTFSHQKVLAFPAVKDHSLPMQIAKYTQGFNNYSFITDYDFGGFAKINEPLIRFINDFKKQTQVALDPIYTGKMVFGIVELFKKGFFNKKNNVLIIHSGGLQGIAGMNQKLIQRQLPVLI